jgi:hypothetical protein
MKKIAIALCILVAATGVWAETQFTTVNLSPTRSTPANVTYHIVDSTGGTLASGTSSDVLSISSSAGMYGATVTVTGDCAIVWKYSNSDIDITPLRLSASQTIVNPVYLNVSTATVGFAPIVNLVQYQYSAFGPLTITTSESQTGKSHKFQVYKPGPPQTQLFSLTTSGGQITVSGTGGNSVTMRGSAACTATAGVFQYLLRNTTDNTVISNGAMTITPAPPQ